MPSSLRLGRAVLPAAALLLAACGGGGGDSGPSSVTISGIVEYEFVPPNPNCQGLDFASTVVRPIRGATLQLVDSSNAELATTVSGEDGRYSFPGVDSNRDLRIRVRAELKKTGSPSWDVEVRDNVVDPDDA
ncbi:MAG: carboxypeptidase-like regulatory domain-containing protein, partial [Gammaproteobacteria bacterium]|nr:carboxypeptidase-like regulatory domain-containing protein [Gammaproteobacteria bacterium]